MLGFGFDYSAISFEYQLKAKTYVITREMNTKLTPAVAIYFDFDSAEPRKDEIPKLRTPSLDIRVEGFNENEGSEPKPDSFIFSIVRKTPVKVSLSYVLYALKPIYNISTDTS